MSTSPLIFLVDDEPAIAEAVGYALQAEGFRCQHHATGSACLAALAGESPALILLDVGLPDGSGFDVFRRIRELGNVPVVFLTARREEIDRVVGLEMGADDYVVKPFSLRELMARVRMVIRRGARSASAGAAPPSAGSAAAAAAAGAATGAAPDAPVAPRRIGPFEHDALRRLMSYRGQPLELTLHEYRLLEVLLAYPGRVYSRGELLERAWEAPDHRLERTVDSHVKSLRAKLRAADPASDPIRTHRGSGYSLDIAP